MSETIRSRKVVPSAKYSYEEHEEAGSAGVRGDFFVRLKRERKYSTAPERGSAIMTISHTHLNSEGLSAESSVSAAASDTRYESAIAAAAGRREWI